MLNSKVQWVGGLLVLLAATAMPAFAAEADVPAEAITDDANVVVWVDMESITDDGMRAAVRSIAGALPASMADARDPMIEGAEEGIADFSRVREAFINAGGQAMLFVLAGGEPAEMEHMGLIRVAPGTEPGAMAAAMQQVSPGEQPELEAYADGWLRVAEEGSAKLAGGTDANAAVFRTLLAEAGDAPVRVALRVTDEMKQEIQAQAAQDPMMGGIAGSIQGLNSAWTSIDLGEGPKISNRLNFADADAAAEFNGVWEGLLMMAEGMAAGQLGQMPDAPEPEAVQKLFESLKMQQDGAALSLVLGEQFIGQAAEFVPAVVGMYMMRMMQGGEFEAGEAPMF